MEKNKSNNVEIWKDIPGYEGLYQVSNMGNVKSLERKVTKIDGSVTEYKSIILKSFTSGKGRLYVNLSCNGIQKKCQVHVLVALTFIGERPENYDVCHIDGNPRNCKLSNLKYDTRNQNGIDIYRYGKKAGPGKLTIKQVLEIRKLYKTGKYRQKDLAKIYKVSQSSIGHIINKKRFAWLNDDGTIAENDTAIKAYFA
ncbi:NUMOD4 motif-containing HNH endonuclease [Staphylococcus saprophyticus]|uniref:NUMOD4 motif-containing HNH endonuclease n=1 Tax=Staphylococcus saprophyticus TaxID=29385 RepID=UPI003851210F